MSKPMSKRQLGMTLIELMMVVAIIGVMATIGVPTYRSHVATVNRSAAQQMLLQVAQKEQQYFLDARSFTSALNNSGVNVSGPSEQGWGACTATDCSNANFVVTVAVSAGPPPTFTATATPTASGSNRGETALTINQAGVKTGTWK